MKLVSVDYPAFIISVTAKNLLIQYVEYEQSYDIFATESAAVCWQTVIVKDGGPDQLNFELNYKSTANSSLFGQKLSNKSIPVVIASDQSSIFVTSAPNLATRVDTFIIPDNGTTINKSGAPVTKFAIQVKGTGSAAAAWDVRLEGSLDGITFTTVVQHTTASTDGAIVWAGSTDSPVLYFRSRCAGLTLGNASAVVVTILGV